MVTLYIRSQQLLSLTRTHTHICNDSNICGNNCFTFGTVEQRSIQLVSLRTIFESEEKGLHNDTKYSVCVCVCDTKSRQQHILLQSILPIHPLSGSFHLLLLFVYVYNNKHFAVY